MPDVDDATLEEMRKEARAIRDRAYAPYSGFAVGAALLDDEGTVHVGVNIENASYPLSVCAERNAVGAMVISGRNRIVAIAVATDADRPTPPCGGCRQVLWEFGGPGSIVVAEGAGEARARWRLGDLLPDAFGPDDLS